MHNPQPLQPHPQPKTVSEKTLKAIPIQNDIDYTVMERNQQYVLDYLLSSEIGEINNKSMESEEKTYDFERNKPLTQRLKTKFNKIRQTMDYNKRIEREERHQVGKSRQEQKLTGIQKRQKAAVTDEQSEFNSYTSSYSISDVKVKGMKALRHLQYQDYRLKECLKDKKV